MVKNNRRDFLKVIGTLSAAATVPGSIDRALAVPAKRSTGTIKDVKHIVILMQENRSFDHYFGTLKGVRGFGDRHTVPLPENRSVWEQHNGARVRTPFWLDTKTTNGMRTPDTPHTFPETHAAWNQGSYGAWPKFKTDFSMGFFKREDIPFHFALAEAFTICDAYHCSVLSCTDPNRIVFWSGSNFDPQERARGVNSSYDKSEAYNIRCHVTGHMPEPGYTFGGNAFEWESIPEVLEKHGIDWRIYQNPNNNANGLFNGCLAFKGFREAKPGSSIYERGMREWTIEQFEQDVKDGKLPTVSWVLPPAEWSEHPSGSTAIEGAEFTSRLIDALTANPDVWASTVFIQTYDENDGFFDHLPPPAPPSFNKDGTLAGKATFALDGEYFDDHEGRYLFPGDDVTGSTRVWGPGVRVPMLVVSPWSKGGWVNSETFDHTSLGRFLEKRFDIEIPAISPWHRHMCGDLTSCFDFSSEGDRAFPSLPDAKGSKAALAAQLQHRNIIPWFAPQGLFEEQGLRRSRALPHVLHVDARTDANGVTLHFINEGTVGVTFHVYDKRHLDRIPRRYAVEAGKSLDDQWIVDGDGSFDLYVLGPNGFMRSFTAAPGGSLPTLVARYDAKAMEIALALENPGAASLDLVVGKDAYRVNTAQKLALAAGGKTKARWATTQSHGWYDFTVASNSMTLGFAGRLENGKPSISDPLMFV